MFDHAVEQEVERRVALYQKELTVLHDQSTAAAASIRTRCGQIEKAIRFSAENPVQAIDQIAHAKGALETAALDLENALRHFAPILADERAPDDAEAAKLYGRSTDNHPTIHSNRFPAWSELTEEQKQEWRKRVFSSHKHTGEPK